MQFCLVFSPLCAWCTQLEMLLEQKKGLLEAMSGVLNYLRNRWSSSSCWEKLYLAHLLHIPRGSDLYSAAAEEKENYCTGSCCPMVEY